MRNNKSLAENIQEVERKLGKKLNEFNDLDWVAVVHYTTLTLTEEFIDCYKEKLDMNELSFISFSEAFLRRNFAHLNKNRVCSQSKLSEAFMDDFKDDLDWEILSERQQMSIAFIEKHKGRICWSKLSLNRHLTKDVIRKYKKELDWKYLSANLDKFDERFIEEIEKYVYFDRVYPNSYSPDFFRKYKDKLDWSIVARGTNIPEVTIEEFLEEFKSSGVPMGYFVLKNDLSEAFLEKYGSEFPIDLISKHQNLSFEFIMKNIDKLNITKVLENKKITLTATQRKQLEDANGLLSTFYISSGRRV